MDFSTRYDVAPETAVAKAKAAAKAKAEPRIVADAKNFFGNCVIA